MFEILNQSTDRCLVVHFSGKPTGQEYQKFLDELEGCLKTAAELNLVLVLSGLQFYGDFEAFQKDYKFSRGEYKRIHRAALVGAKNGSSGTSASLLLTLQQRRSILPRARSRRLLIGR